VPCLPLQQTGTLRRVRWEMCELLHTLAQKTPVGERSALYVRFAPKADKPQTISSGPLCATSRHMQRNKKRRYSITSSARSRIAVGNSIPIALAVLRLMTSSNLVGSSTGKSAGFAPCSTLATMRAVW
jgi:hypothetical protein